MTWFFEDAAHVQALRTEAASWFGTPFHFYSRAKGYDGGIDCVGFCEEVTAAAGLERWAFERSGEDYSRHVINDTIANLLRGKIENDASRTLAARWAELPVKDNDFTEPPMVGDLVLYKDGSRETGSAVFHIGVMISPTIFMQCAPRIKVCEAQIDDPTYSGKLFAHFRARSLPAAAGATPLT